MAFQIILIVLFMLLVEYGDQSRPTPITEGGEVEGNKTDSAAKSEKAVNDISVYYPSKCAAFSSLSQILNLEMWF